MVTDHEMRMEALRLFEENERLRAEIEQLQAKIDRAVEVYGQKFTNPHERARQMWFALHGERDANR